MEGQLNPENPLPGTLTCTRLSPCVTGGAPVTIVYTVRDVYDNTSTGVIKVEAWHTLLPSANINIFVQGDPIPLNIQLAGTVVSTGAGLATVRFGAGAGITLATPPGTNLVVGDVVSFRISPPPLTVAGSIPDICIKQPDGTVACNPSGCPAEPTPGTNCFQDSPTSVTVTRGTTT